MGKLTAEKLAEEHGMISVGEVKAIKSIKKFLPDDPVIVNIGAGLGTSALALLEMSPDAWLTTIDIKEKALHREGVSLKRAGVDLTRYVTVRCDSIRMGREWRKPIDVLFVDGKHTYEYVSKEIRVWAPHVKEGGFIFFHDFGKGNPAWEQVRQAVREWLNEEYLGLYKRERILVAVRIPSWGRHLKRHNLKHYVDLLSTDSPFGLARYGDGEWLAILGEIGRKNSNGCTFTQELCDLLRDVLKNNLPYEHSILSIARRKLGSRIGKFLKEGEYEVEWTMGDTILEASTNGKLWPLIAQLRQKTIVYVGPEYMRPIHDLFFKYVSYIQIPPVNAYEERERIILEIIEAVEKDDANFIGFSSGHHTHIFMDALWTHFNGEISMIDFGSIWDGYLGVKSRKYLRKDQHDFDELYIKNIRRKQE